MNTSKNISATTPEAKDVFVSQHLSLPEFLFTACMIVVALTAVSTFWSLLMKVEIYMVRKWKRRRGQKVAPAPKDGEKTNTKSKKKGETYTIEKTDEEQDEEKKDVENETAVDAAKDDAKATLEENVEDALALEVELPFKAEEVETPENEEKAEFVEMLMNVLHSGITIYLIGSIAYAFRKKLHKIPLIT